MDLDGAGTRAYQLFSCRRLDQAHVAAPVESYEDLVQGRVALLGCSGHGPVLKGKRLRRRRRRARCALLRRVSGDRKLHGRHRSVLLVRQGQMVRQSLSAVHARRGCRLRRRICLGLWRRVRRRLGRRRGAYGRAVPSDERLKKMLYKCCYFRGFICTEFMIPTDKLLKSYGRKL